MKKRVICLVIALVSTFLFAMNASADGVTERLDELRSVYPNQKYWNHYVSNESESGNALQRNGNSKTFADSVSDYPCANHGGSLGDAWYVGKYDCNYYHGFQCNGFARRVFYKVFGQDIGSASANRKDFENILPGDFVHMTSSSTHGHYAIVLSKNGDKITIVEANHKNNCQIWWDREIDISRLKYFKRASNYDKISNSTVNNKTSIPDGTYQIVSALNGEKSAISIEGDSLKSKANAHLWERHIGNSEKFNITKSGDYYTIINFSSGKALDIEDGSKKSGANVWQYEPNNSDAQKWQFEDAGDGYVYIKSALGKYLDVSGGKSANGTNIQVYNGNQTSSQMWLLVPVYYLDLNGVYDGINTGSLMDYATADVYINGNLEGNDINDYYFMLPKGTRYEIKDIKVNSGYTYDGLSSGKLSGTISETVRVNLEFSKAHTHSFVGKYYDNKHPHKEYKKCSCGATEYTGATRSVDSCLTCNPTKEEEEKIHETGSLTVTFDPMGGTVSPKSKKAEFCTPYGALPTPRRTGYIFEGWFSATSKEIKSTDYVMDTYDHTLYASWLVDKEYILEEEEEEEEIKKEYIITYNANGGIEPPSPKTVNEGSSFKVSSEKLSRNGYKFLGWSESKNAKTPYYTGGERVKPTSDITLYAVWAATGPEIEIILTIDSTAALISGKTEYNDVAPIIENSRTMLPARFVAEKLGASVVWDDINQKVTIANGKAVIEIFIGSSTARVNGEEKALDTPAFIRDSRTYTPVRFICEELGADVEWDADNRQVIITK